MNEGGLFLLGGLLGLLLGFIIGSLIAFGNTEGGWANAVERAAICAKSDPHADAAKYESCLRQYLPTWPGNETNG